MATSLEQLLSSMNIPRDQIIKMKTVCKPKHRSFISLLQPFEQTKVMPSRFDIMQYNERHQLVSYSKHTFGVYASSSGHTLFSTDGYLNDGYTGDRVALPSPKLIIKFNIDEYCRARDEYDKFWEWRRGRNTKRAALEEQFGFDTKHAMHLVRLLRIGAEALETGVINVKRADAQELLDIRAGKWTYEQVVEYAEYMDNKVRNELYPITDLPKKPNIALAAELTLAVQDLVWTQHSKQQ